jgi:hypothetical protein
VGLVSQGWSIFIVVHELGKISSSVQSTWKTLSLLVKWPHWRDETSDHYLVKESCIWEVVFLTDDTEINLQFIKHGKVPRLPARQIQNARYVTVMMYKATITSEQSFCILSACTNSHDAIFITVSGVLSYWRIGHIASLSLSNDNWSTEQTTIFYLQRPKVKIVCAIVTVFHP